MKFNIPQPQLQLRGFLYDFDVEGGGATSPTINLGIYVNTNDFIVSAGGKALTSVVGPGGTMISFGVEGDNALLLPNTNINFFQAGDEIQAGDSRLMTADSEVTLTLSAPITAGKFYWFLVVQPMPF